MKVKIKMSNKNKKECPICHRVISTNNYIKHIYSHEHNTEYQEKLLKRQSISHKGLNCQYCGKLCKSKKSLAQHECRCKNNSNRISVIHTNFNDIGHCSWSKGQKAATCLSIKRQQETYQKNKALGKHKMSHRKHTEEEKNKLRIYALKQGLGGFNMHRVKYEVNGIQVDSSYEKIVAESLTKNGINWKRAKRFKYRDLSDKVHYYTPDFYLSDYDIYLDPKNDYLINNVNPILGYKDLDKISWVMQQNNIKVIVLDKDHLTWDQIKNIIDK